MNSLHYTVGYDIYVTCPSIFAVQSMSKLAQPQTVVFVLGCGGRTSEASVDRFEFVKSRMK